MSRLYVAVAAILDWQNKLIRGSFKQHSHYV